MCFSRNFLELNIYMRDLRVQKYDQREAYTLIDLLSKMSSHCYIWANQTSISEGPSTQY